MLNLDFLKRGLGIVPPPYFGYEFSKKLFKNGIPLTDHI